MELWRLRKSEAKEEFAERVNKNVMVMKIGVVLKRMFLAVGSEIYGYTNGKPRQSEM